MQFSYNIYLVIPKATGLPQPYTVPFMPVLPGDTITLTLGGVIPNNQDAFASMSAVVYLAAPYGPFNAGTDLDINAPLYTPSSPYSYITGENPGPWTGTWEFLIDPAAQPGSIQWIDTGSSDNTQIVALNSSAEMEMYLGLEASLDTPWLARVSITVNNDARIAPPLPGQFTDAQKEAFGQAAESIELLSEALKDVSAATDPSHPARQLAAELIIQLSGALDPQLGQYASAVHTAASVAESALEEAPGFNPISLTLSVAGAMNGLTAKLLKVLQADPADGDYTNVYQAPDWTFGTIAGASTADNNLVTDSWKLLQDVVNILAASERYQGAELSGDSANAAMQNTAFNTALADYNSQGKTVSADLNAVLAEVQTTASNVNLSTDQTLANVQSYIAGLTNPLTSDPFLSAFIASINTDAPYLSSVINGDVQQALTGLASEQAPGFSGSAFAAISAAATQLASAVSSVSAATDTGGVHINAGHLVTVTLNLNEAVTVTGTPTLQLNDNEVAFYTSGSGTNTLTFAYVVQAGDNVADLQVSALNLPTGASIVDGNNTSLSGPVTSDLGIQIDTTPPVVAISSTGGLTNHAAQTVSGTVDVADAGTIVTVYDGTTALGTATVQANGSWSDSITLAGNGTHTLTAQDTDAAGNIGISNAVIYNLQTTPPPTISSLTATTDTGIPYVNAGHVVTITMTTSEAVTVTGVPTLQLNDNEVAAYTFGSGSNTLSFSYVAQTGDNVADLQVTGLNLPTGASILDGNGNSLVGSVTSDLGIQVDTVTVPLTSVQQQVLGLYGVLYDRAADFGGLSYWTGVVGQQPDGAGVTVANGASTAITINDATVLGQLFVSTESSYFNQVYGAMSDSTFITTLYGTIGGNTIGIAPGITYWSGVLQALETAGQSQQAARAGIVGEIVQAMIDYNINIRPAGYTDAEWLAAQQRQETTDNKVAVSLAYSNASQQPGGTILDAVTVTDAAFLAATRAIEGVTYDGTTADAAISHILYAVALQDLTQIQPVGVVSGGLMG